MIVNNVTSGTIPYELIDSRVEKMESSLETNRPKPVAEMTIIDEENIDEATSLEDTEIKRKGVIRNLLEGHFKGVADVRLRINFAEEINEIDKQGADLVAVESIKGLSGILDTEIASISSNPEIGEGNSILLSTAYSDFHAEISRLTENVDSKDFNSNYLISNLKSAFTEFVTSANSSSEQVADGSLVDEGQSVEAVGAVESIAFEEPAVNNTEDTAQEISADEIYSQLLSGLITLFQNEINNIEKEVTSYSSLPPISEPSGNGKAFDKFMAIYNTFKNNDSDQTEIAPMVEASTTKEVEAEKAMVNTNIELSV
ncbi:MAG: hypothetical protein ABIJ45_08970 [Candidatus Zixiibacteriota bacterium]